ncbi:hypothetical protein J6590_026282 [Homalodisca vitripennis]|nr:hypothetical protein J6590_026282 [Homalodisca vitripennis]
MKLIIVCAFLTCCNPYADAKRFPLFPEELQTLFNVIYSILPPTKIGSDKRFGVGFRVGKNIDAQILVELGPQTETQPLADPNPRLFSRKRESGKGGKSAGKAAGANFNKLTTSTIPPVPLHKENKVLEHVNATDPPSKLPSSKGRKPHIPSDPSSNPGRTTKKRQRKRKKLPKSTSNASTSRRLDNAGRKSEPFLDVFMKWLTRFGRTREDNFTNNLIRK